ncbi:hypothetical protein [Candidatus Scalindua japonica]|uniref:hypothetical protein n=1 Tax=Candidatus Scalindua japonica TaxID=1284222 RepID=UPI000BDF5CC9|nr:hypothetical protein [Candidatus Scalindua japonica]
MVKNEGNKKSKIVDGNHELLGKHVISLTVPLTLFDATKIAGRFNSMPSNPDREMFTVKLVSNQKSKEKNYLVVRKLCIGDSIDFIDYPKE